MATLRAQRGAPKSPSTNFNLYADLVTRHAPGDGSPHGGWTITIGIQGVNTGNTSSYSGYAGSHYGYYRQAASGNYSLATSYGDNPFIRSGYGGGAERWWRGNTIRINANSDGYVRGTSSVVDLLQEVYSSDPDWLGTGSGPFQSFGSIDVGRVNQAPGAPTGLTVGARTDTTIALTWSAPSSNGGAAITGYTVEYATDPSFTGALSANTTGTSVTLTGLALSAYYIRVRARNSVGTGSASAVATTATVTRPGKPDAPALVSRTATSMQLNLSDPVYTGDGITARQLERSLSPTFSGAVSVPITMPDTAVTGLTRATQYYYRFRVQNSVGWSDWATVSASTLVEKPSAPTGYTVTDVASQSALLNLGLVVDTGGSALSAMKYEVQTVAGVAQTARELSTYTPAWFSWSALGDIRVRMAVKNSGDSALWSDWGAWVTFTPNLTVPNAAALALTVLSDTSIKSDWVAPTILNGSEIWGYRLRLSTTSEFTLDSIVVDLAATTLTHTFTGLQPGTKYYSQIYAISSNGPGTRNTPAAEATTTGVAPTAQPLWMRVAGAWRPGNLRMRVAGTWRSGVLWENINGTWRKY